VSNNVPQWVGLWESLNKGERGRGVAGRAGKQSNYKESTVLCLENPFYFLSLELSVLMAGWQGPIVVNKEKESTENSVKEQVSRCIERALYLCFFFQFSLTNT